jgi:hypothetical protein
LLENEDHQARAGQVGRYQKPTLVRVLAATGSIEPEFGLESGLTFDTWDVYGNILAS